MKITVLGGPHDGRTVDRPASVQSTWHGRVIPSTSPFQSVPTTALLDYVLRTVKLPNGATASVLIEPKLNEWLLKTTT